MKNQRIKKKSNKQNETLFHIPLVLLTCFNKLFFLKPIVILFLFDQLVNEIFRLGILVFKCKNILTIIRNLLSANAITSGTKITCCEYVFNVFK